MLYYSAFKSTPGNTLNCFIVAGLFFSSSILPSYVCHESQVVLKRRVSLGTRLFRFLMWFTFALFDKNLTVFLCVVVSKVSLLVVHFVYYHRCEAIKLLKMLYLFRC